MYVASATDAVEARRLAVPDNHPASSALLPDAVVTAEPALRSRPPDGAMGTRSGTNQPGTAEVGPAYPPPKLPLGAAPRPGACNSAAAVLGWLWYPAGCPG